MLGSLRPRCALIHGSSVSLVFRPARRSLQTTVSRRQHATKLEAELTAKLEPKLEPIIPKGETPDPQLGDYPQLDGISTQARPPLGYWDAQYRRNFGEPVGYRQFFDPPFQIADK